MKLSPHFTLAEFEFSETASRHRLSNRIPEPMMPNLGRLVGMLEQVRLGLQKGPL